MSNPPDPAIPHASDSSFKRHRLLNSLGAFLLMANVGTLAAVGFLIVPGMERFEVQAAQMTLIFTVLLLSGAVALPIAGRIIIRVGVRPVVVVSSLLAIASVVGMIFAPDLTVFTLLWIPFGAASAGSGILVATSLMTGWYSPQARGRAIGIISTGAAIGGTMWGLVMPPVIIAYGWTGAFVAILLYLVIVALVPGLFLISNPPISQAALARAVAGETGISRRSLRGPLVIAVIGLAVAAFLVNTEATFAQLQPAVYAAKGIDPILAGQFVSFLSLCAFVMGPIMGFLHDKLGVYALMIILAIAYGVGLPAVAILAGVSTVGMFLVLPLIGFAITTGSVALPLVAGHVVGPQRYPGVYGFVQMGGYLGSAVSAPLWGIAFDTTGDYDIALLIGAGCAILGLAVFTILYARRRRITEALDADDAASMDHATADHLSHRQ
ncbi:nitrate/nitrite transporter NarK [Rathayibacter sp. PhB93]|uniref:MFS transporter n=1 Tax=unclassified Rathayibacter TaxID=2609250 RepID=UPI000F47E085|nr:MULTISPECIES: MFS transporter [unclassified Rathayibacter]ROQ04631.1 nitrate/nitrite transporter NarK [Rathayibacter sp. PhB93]TDQ13469.1 nitrate/nitrite transporter NarK [Rathayibacter sp. PhB1]